MTRVSAALVTIEGIDGSGKGTQAELLAERVRAGGGRAAVLSFPRYEQTTFGREVAAYLNGHYGPLDGLSPKLVAMLYAGDRFESLSRLAELGRANDVLICDRYTYSNVAHQGAKVADRERGAFTSWIEHLEFAVYGLPRPDAVLYLDMPPLRAQELVLRKRRRIYTDRQLDLHEADLSYLEHVHRVYGDLVGRPGWVRIRCAENDAVLTPEEVHARIWDAIAGSIPLGLRRSRT